MHLRAIIQRHTGDGEVVSDVRLHHLPGLQVPELPRHVGADRHHIQGVGREHRVPHPPLVMGQHLVQLILVLLVIAIGYYIPQPDGLVSRGGRDAGHVRGDHTLQQVLVVGQDVPVQHPRLY